MIKPTIKTTLYATLATLLLLFGSNALAQFDMAAYDAYMATLKAQQDAWMAQQMAQIEALERDGRAALIKYYREETGDYQTPDALAFEYGVNLYCQRNAAHCAEIARSNAQQAQLNAARMRDIESWGAVNAGIAASNSSILDASHAGFLNRSAIQDTGHANMIEGAIQGQWTYANPSTGAGWSLPVVPDPNSQYWTPEGQPLAFDFQAGVWYVGTQGGWTLLQPRR